MKEVNQKAQYLRDLIIPDDLQPYLQLQKFLADLNNIDYEVALQKSLDFLKVIDFSEFISNTITIAGTFSEFCPKAIKLLKDLCAIMKTPITFEQLINNFPDFFIALNKAGIISESTQELIPNIEYTEYSDLWEIIQCVMKDDVQGLKNTLKKHNIMENGDIAFNIQDFFQVSNIGMNRKCNLLSISALFNSVNCYQYFKTIGFKMTEGSFQCAILGNSLDILNSEKLSGSLSHYLNFSLCVFRSNIFDFLLKKYGFIYIPLLDLIKTNNIEGIFFYLSKRYKVYITEEEMKMAIDCCCTEAIRVFLHFKNAVSPELKKKSFFLALNSKPIDMIKLLHEKGFCYDTYNGYSALHYALGNNRDAVDFVIQNIGDHFINIKIWSTDYPIYVAVDNNKIDIINYLLEKGANVNIRKYDNILLHAKSFSLFNYFLETVPDILPPKSKVEVLKSLIREKLKFNVNPNLVIESLIKYGVDINMNLRGSTVLIEALKVKNDNPIIQTLINNGADIMATDRYGYNALHHACNMDDAKNVFRFLISGVDPNVTTLNGNRPITLAKDPYIIVNLIKYGAETNFIFRGKNFLNYLFDKRQFDKLETLIKNGADPNVIYDKKSNTSLLSKTITTNNFIVSSCIAESALIKIDDPSLIITLLKQQSNRKSAIYLFNLFVSLNPECANVLGKDGNTPIFYVLDFQENLFLEMTTALLNNGANINHQNDMGETPLINCIKRKNQNFADFLLRKGADPNIKDSKGKTALHYAAERSFMCREILCFGGDVNILDNNGRLPCELAHFHTRELLRPDNFEFELSCIGKIIASGKKLLWMFGERYLGWKKEVTEEK